jgi:(p)ppGpp synthase/HD superfamily hydrolase
VKEIEDVIKFIMIAHEGQKYGGLPYVVHPMLVARHFEDPVKIIAALLHDVVEDTNFTNKDIKDRFGVQVAQIVDVLTKRQGEVYFEDYIYRVANHEIATEIKIADLEENIHSIEYWYTGYSSLLDRYEKALGYLKKVSDPFWDWGKR